MAYFYRNAGGDELLFVHHGEGTLETLFGELAYRAHDYLVIPSGTTWRLRPDAATRLVVHESSGAVEIPRMFRNEFGQLEEHAPYYERDFRAPVLRDPVDAPGEYEVRVTTAAAPRPTSCRTIRSTSSAGTGTAIRTRSTSTSTRRSPASCTSRRPRTQPSKRRERHSARSCRVCSTYHPLAIPVPYNHSSVDCDEVIYYVSGNFMSRRGIEEGSVTLHAAGAPHGPQPGAVEASLGKTSTDEVAIMVDTFKPLALTEAAARRRGRGLLPVVGGAGPRLAAPEAKAR